MFFPTNTVLVGLVLATVLFAAVSAQTKLVAGTICTSNEMCQSNQCAEVEEGTEVKLGKRQGEIVRRHCARGRVIYH
jgi:hypothetical protein